MNNPDIITIRKNGETIGTVECYENNLFITDGVIGAGNSYGSLKELILGLQGFDIEMDDLFF